MPHSPCRQALHLRHRTRLLRAPDTIGETVGLTVAGRGAGFMVCGFVMGIVGNLNFGRDGNLSCQVKKGKKIKRLIQLARKQLCLKIVVPKRFGTGNLFKMTKYGDQLDKKRYIKQYCINKGSTLSQLLETLHILYVFRHLLEMEFKDRPPNLYSSIQKAELKSRICS